MLGAPALGSPAHAERTILQQTQEGAAKAQKIGGPQRKLQHELVKVADGTKFGRYIEQLLQLMSLGTCGSAEFGVRNGDGSKTRYSRQQRLLLWAKITLLPRVDQDRTVGAGGADRNGQQHSGRNQVPESMAGGVNGHRDRLPRAHCASSQLSDELEGFTVVTGANRTCQLRRLSRHRM